MRALFAVALFCSACAAPTSEANAAHAALAGTAAGWVRTFPAREDDATLATSGAPDGSAWMLGILREPTDLGGGTLAPRGRDYDHQAMVLLHASATGEHLWSRAFDGPFARVSPARLAVAADGTVVTVGFAETGADFGDGMRPHGLFVARYSAQGEPLASFATCCNGGVTALQLAPDGDALVAAQVVDLTCPLAPMPTTSAATLLVTRFGPEGELRWATADVVQTSDGSRIEGIVLLADGDLVVHGTFRGHQPFGSTGASDSSWHGFLARLSGTDGKVVWSRALPTAQTVLRSLPGGDFAALRWDYAQGLAPAKLCRLDPFGNERWCRSAPGRSALFEVDALGRLVVVGFARSDVDVGFPGLVTTADGAWLVARYAAEDGTPRTARVVMVTDRPPRGLDVRGAALTATGVLLTGHVDDTSDLGVPSSGRAPSGFLLYSAD